ncbi:MAG: DNA polymerase III subunit delta [Rickettsiales bacterium]|jgi:DNA polymerase III delta subunit|nr:DNA polymerase III subunit delta [Rickettsiales bacterium]
MKIDNKNVEKFIGDRREQQKYEIIFLYGRDEPAVSFRFKKILDDFKNDNYLIRDIDQSELKQDKSILSQEFSSTSFFGDRTLITVRLTERENDYAKCFGDLLGEKNFGAAGNRILLSAGDLEKSSSLLGIMEKSERAAVVVCYREDEWKMEGFISQELKKYNFAFYSDVVKYLSDSIGRNKQLVENEIRKIDCYKGDDRKLTIDDVKKTTRDLATFDAQDLVNAFCSFNQNELFRLLEKFFREKTPMIMLCRSMISCFLQLQRMRYAMENMGQSAEAAVFAQFGQRILFRQRDETISHLNRWTLKNINIFLEKLLEFEKLKFSGEDRLPVENFLLRAVSFFRQR